MLKATIARVLSILARGEADAPPAFDGFFDSLLQKFENCRPGLPDAVVAVPGEAAPKFFVDLYEAERPRLFELMRQAEPLLDEEGLRRFVKTVDDLIRSVVIPAYLRIALPFTLRERNDFYRLPAPFHVAERILCGLGALLLGVFIIEAPFIPIWSKEILFPMLIAGLFLPNLRKLLSMRRFERELNDVVVRADREVARIDANLLLDEGVTECELPLLENQQHPETRRQPDHETLKGES